MEFDKNGILNRAKAAQQTAAVMDEIYSLLLIIQDALKDY